LDHRGGCAVAFFRGVAEDFEGRGRMCICPLCGRRRLPVCGQARVVTGIELHEFVDALGGGRKTGAEKECSERELGEAH
jgi:hypothetical protein